MRSVLAIIFFMAACGITLPAQSPDPLSGTFKITQTNPIISTATISGKEGYKISVTPEGFAISSHVWVANGETPILSEVEETLNADWSLKRYKFNGLVGGIKQEFEAWVDGSKVQIQVTGERMNPHRTVDLAPNTVVLDNFVPTHFQVLLNRFAAASAKVPDLQSQDVLLIVPQRLVALRGKLSRSGTDSGLLDGKPVQLQKYVLEATGVKAELWADDQNQVLGAYFVQPDVEYLQDHFELPQLKLATLRKLPSERPVSFTSHGRQLLGTLMLPPQILGARDKYPLVVLVAGFGPLDRDETVGRSKPLRDIAVGLANKGIATLRYDKPTYTFHGKMDPAHLTVQEETVDAAAAAIVFARTLPEVDAQNVFLLGHSEGGELAPFILRQVNDVRGAILMAAPGRRPDEFLPEQLAAGLKMRGMAQQIIEARVKSLKQQLLAIREGKTEATEVVLDMPAGFWRSLMQKDSLAGLRQVNVPVLVLQGSSDGYISRTDFDLVTSAVRPEKLESQYFNGLDHIFAPAPEGSNGSEMLIGTHVANEVIERITAWLQKQTSEHRVDVASRSQAH